MQWIAVRFITAQTSTRVTFDKKISKWSFQLTTKHWHHPHSWMSHHLYSLWCFHLITTYVIASKMLQFLELDRGLIVQTGIMREDELCRFFFFFCISECIIHHLLEPKNLLCHIRPKNCVRLSVIFTITKIVCVLHTYTGRYISIPCIVLTKVDSIWCGREHVSSITLQYSEHVLLYLQDTGTGWYGYSGCRASRHPSNLNPDRKLKCLLKKFAQKEVFLKCSTNNKFQNLCQFFFQNRVFTHDLRIY